MTIKNIEMAYEEIYDFLDEIDSHPLSAQISLPIPDLVDGVWVDKYFVYEDVSVGGKHIAYSPEWIFTFSDGSICSHTHCEESNSTVEYRLSKSLQSNIVNYIEQYNRFKSLPVSICEDKNNEQDIIVDQYFEALKNIIPKEILGYYTTSSVLLRMLSS